MSEKKTPTQNTSWGLTAAGRKRIAYWSMVRAKLSPVQRRAHRIRFVRATPRRGSPLATLPMWCSSTSTSKPEIFAAFTPASAEQDRDVVARRIGTFLENAFPQAAVTVTTDLAITLQAAVGDGEGLVLIISTGSAAYGRGAGGETARAGGRGPWFSDEGSAFDIGRRALAAVVRAEENRGPETALSERVLKWLGCAEWNRVLDWVVKNPDDVFPRIFPLVAELGDKGDPVCESILSNAAESLTELVASVLSQTEVERS